MPAQDDARENRMLDLFNLERPADRVRHGTDAILTIGDRLIEFELKSVTTKRGGLTTVRDFGPDHIAKWKNKHWLIATYGDNQLLHCQYGSPAAMAPWIEEKWKYIRADFELAKYVPNLIDLRAMFSIVGAKELYSLNDAKKLHKSQYSKKQYVELMDIFESSAQRTKALGYSQSRMLSILRDRTRYVIERGSTLNNPHIPSAYFTAWEQIKRDHALRLRQLVGEWIAANEPQARVPLQAKPDTP